MDKKAIEYTNRIVDGLSIEQQDKLEMSHQLCLYYMIKIQLYSGVVLLSKVLYETSFNVGKITSYAQKLKEMGIIDETLVNGTYIYEVNLVSEETPCQ